MRSLPALFLCACVGPPGGLRETPPGNGPLVRVDWDALPLPDIPFPNDLATRPDPASPTGLRPNLPTLADVDLERSARQHIDGLSGWGIFAPITVGFDGRLDLDEVLRRHPPLEAFTPESYRDDAVYVIDVTPGSTDFGQPVPLDFGSGRFPQDSTQLGAWLPNDPRADQPSLLFETGEEDVDGDGVLDPGEDTDGDGLLDHPNVWPAGGDPRLDLLSWYDLETDALQFRPVLPLREHSTYAVVLTTALVDESGNPVRSPWEFVNHTRQTAALEPVIPALEAMGRSVDDIAFAWTFTTGEVTRDLWNAAEGVRGRGPFSSLAADYPAGVTEAHHLWTTATGNPLILPVDTIVTPLSELGFFPDSSLSFLEDAYPAFTSGVVGGAFVSPDLLYDRDDGGRDTSDEVWDLDSSTGRIEAAPNRIVFSCALPTPSEGKGPPWPVDIHMHGYGSARIELVAFAYALNREGIAVCGFDAPGHGIELTDSDLSYIETLMKVADAEPLLWHLLDDRKRDLDNDGVPDVAGDQFSADAFHSRDMLRQPVLDAVQLVQSLKQCGTGQMEEVVPTADGLLDTKVARTSCDWDGDGVPDIGGPDVAITLDGVSMGGIETSLSAAVQEADSAVATVPGGGLGDVGVRTDIDAVSDGMVGRALSPLIIGVPSGDSLEVEEVVISVDHSVEIPISSLPSIPVGGTVVVRNLDLDREESGIVPADGRFRVPIAANALDPAGKAELTGIPVGGVVAGVTYGVDGNAGLGDRLEVVVTDANGASVAVVDAFGDDVVEEGVTYARGSPLVAVSYGLGLRRGSADLRRTLGVLALAVEPGDPIAYARHWADEPFDGKPTPVMIHLTAGDTTVPIATGYALARAAGLLNVEADDPRYGETTDRFLADKGALRGMEEYGPWTGADGQSLLFDVDDLDRGTDGTGAPSDKVLRTWRPVDNGVSGLRVLYVNQTGTHAYGFPDESLAFDWDLFAAQQMAWFNATKGTEISDDPCLATRNCPFLRPMAAYEP